MAQFERKGIVAKIGADSCIVLTPQGSFVKIPLPAEEIRVGAEISYRKSSHASTFRPWLLAATFLLALISCSFYHRALVPQPVGFVSLDINPSLEMSVDKDLQVIDVHAFNDEAVNLLRVLDLEGSNLDQALTELINQAIVQNYIADGQDNIMISTVSPLSSDGIILDQITLYKVMQNTIASRGFSGQVRIYSVSGDFHKAAGQNEVSAGKYLIYEQLVRSGESVTINDIKHQSVSQLARTYQFNMLPNFKKIMIQTAKTDQGPIITVDENGQGIAIEDFFKAQESLIASEGRNPTPVMNASRSSASGKSRLMPVNPLASLDAIPEV